MINITRFCYETFFFQGTVQLPKNANNFYLVEIDGITNIKVLKY